MQTGLVRVLAANPKVREVGVAGIPDAYRGETVKAWIVLKDGETATEEGRASKTRSLTEFIAPREGHGVRDGQN